MKNINLAHLFMRLNNPKSTAESIAVITALPQGVNYGLQLLADANYAQIASSSYDLAYSTAIMLPFAYAVQESSRRIYNKEVDKDSSIDLLPATFLHKAIPKLALTLAITTPWATNYIETNRANIEDKQVLQRTHETGQAAIIPTSKRAQDHDDVPILDHVYQQP